MGIIRRIFKKKPEQVGNILVTPQEASQLSNKQLDVRQGSNIQIVGETSKTTSGGSVGGGSYSTTTGGVTTTISPTGKVTTVYQSGGGGSSYIPSATTTQAQQILQQTPISPNMEKGTGGLRDYQFQQSIKKDMALQTARQTAIYQGALNKGEFTEAEANKRLNRQLRDYQIARYKEEGYTVTENADGSITTKYNLTKVPKTSKLGGVFIEGGTQGATHPSPLGRPIDENDLFMQQSIKESEQILNIPEGSSNLGYIPEALVSRQAPPLRERGGFVGGVAVTTENIITGIEGSKAYQTVLGTREEPTRARTFLFGTGMFPEGSKVYAGSVPFIPAGSFGGVQNIKFIGTQKALKGGDISTDVLFKVKSRVGIARGVTRTGEEISQTVVAGRTGILGVKFPTASVKGGRITSFVSRGFSKESQVGEYTKSVGVAQSASARRTKLINTAIEFPTGRLMKKPALSLFKDLSISKSFALQDENIIKIVGVSKSVRGSRATYQGIIRVVDTGEEGFKGYTFLGRGGKGFRQPTQAQLQASAKDVASQIAGAVIKTPSTTLQKATSISSVGLNKVQPLSFKGSITSNIVLEKKAQQGIITSVSPKAISTNQNVKFVDSTIIKQPSVLRTQQETSQIQKSYLQTMQIPREMQVTKTLQAQKTLQVQKQVPLLVSKYKQTQVSRLVIPIRLPQIKVGKPFGLPLKIKPSAKGYGGFFTISERRFGVFRPIGKATDLGKAFNIGVGQTGRTLGASYKVQDIFGKTYAGPSKNYYTKMEKGGIVNIQRRSKRLSSLSERQAIQTAKRLTKGSKKKKKRGGKSLW